MAKEIIKHQRAEFSGPIPPPSVLKQYNEVVPNAAERILKMAENQSQHRHFLEKKVITSDVFNSRLGVSCAFIISLCFIAASLYATIHNHPVYGGFVGVGGLTALVSVFIYGSRLRQKERGEKCPQK